MPLARKNDHGMHLVLGVLLNVRPQVSMQLYSACVIVQAFAAIPQARPDATLWTSTHGIEHAVTTACQ